MARVIEWGESVGRDGRDRVIEALRERLKGRVSAAWIFGSFATGRAMRSSDCDLLLVADSADPFWERARAFDDLYGVMPRLDVLVYRPEELDALLAEPVGFWKSVRDSMVRVI